MKHMLIYFTSTGNSLYVAKSVAQGLGAAEVLGMPAVMKRTNKTISADTIGLVFPVYCWGLPKLVFDFIQTMKLQAPYVYAVATYGGCPGYTNLQLQAELAKKGVALKAGFGIGMPGNYTPLYGAPSAKAQDKFFKKMAEKVPQIVEHVRTQKSAKIENGPAIVNVLLRLTGFYKLFLSQVSGSDKAFVVQENCTGCGVCAKVCPVDNILIKNNKPEWQHHCENCMGCLQWCPEEAIQAGKTTQGRKRYHHPQIVLAEICGQKIGA